MREWQNKLVSRRAVKWYLGISNVMLKEPTLNGWARRICRQLTMFEISLEKNRITIAMLLTNNKSSSSSQGGHLITTYANQNALKCRRSAAQCTPRNN